MITAELIDRARAAGLELIDRGDKLRVCGPEPLPTDLLDDLREFKGDILEHLRCQSEPLPPEGDPRREPLELIDQVWAAGCWLVITADRVRAVSRDEAAPSSLLPPDLLARVETHQAELFRALTRIPRSLATKSGEVDDHHVDDQ